MTGRQQSAQRAQQLTLLSGILICLALLMAAQLILLSVAIDGFRRGQRELLASSALASGLCFAAACWLLRHLPPRTRAELLRED